MLGLKRLRSKCIFETSLTLLNYDLSVARPADLHHATIDDSSKLHQPTSKYPRLHLG